MASAPAERAGLRGMSTLPTDMIAAIATGVGVRGRVRTGRK